MRMERDYLTSAEIGYIVKAMIEKDNAVDREIVKVALVAQLVCEDIGNFEDCNDIYDLVMANSDISISEFVRNYDIIDKIYKEETGIEKILNDFVYSINTKLDEVTKNMDLNGAISQLKEISDKKDTPKNVKGGKNGTRTTK